MAISDFFSGGQTPDYLAGLLDDEQLRRLKANAQQNALMQFGLSALSQGGYSQTPVGAGEIFGRAGLAGMQGYQQGIQHGIEGIGTRAKLEELQRAKKQREAEDLFRSRIGQNNATRNVMTQPTAQVNAPQYANAPNFQTQPQAPEPYYDEDVLMRDALKSGALSPEKYFELTKKEKAESPFAKIDPSKFTQNSILRFTTTGRFDDLVPIAPADAKFKVGETRIIHSGNQTITEEYGADGLWHRYAKSPKWEPPKPEKPDPWSPRIQPPLTPLQARDKNGVVYDFKSVAAANRFKKDMGE